MELLQSTLKGMQNRVEEVVGQQKQAHEFVNEVTTHRGEWNEVSRQYLALRFIEKYVDAVGLKDRAALQPGKFYAPLAIHHDVKGKALVGGRLIWDVSECSVALLVFSRLWDID